MTPAGPQGSRTHGRITLKHGREGPVRGGSPWLFSQAIDRIEPAGLEPGAEVEVHDSAGQMLGWGYYNPATTIAIRMLAWGDEPAPEQIIEYRLRCALDLRRELLRGDTNCYRLVNGDGDALSGVVVDRYADVLVVQLLTAGADRMRDGVVQALQNLVRPRAIIERSQGAVRREEGLENRVGLIAGEPVAELVVVENGIRVGVNLERGQKTGAFLDQCHNRLRFGQLASGRRVLDAYCYGGGFTLAALRGGASHVVAVDTSAKVLEWARRNLELNGYSADVVEFVHDDAASYLRHTREHFDLIVLDPPPLARSRRDASRAQRLYIELNAMAIKALAPRGYLMTFSCSVHFRGEDFVRAVRFAQAQAGRQMRILAHLGAGPDHPVLLGHVEGEYLTGVLLADLAWNDSDHGRGKG